METKTKNVPKLWRQYIVDNYDLELLRQKIYDYARNHDDVDIVDVRNRIDPPTDYPSRFDDSTKNNNKPNDINNNIKNIIENSSVKSNDWMLKRFLISCHRDVDKAFEQLLEFYRFRTQFHVSKMTMENSLPREFYQLKPIETIGNDKQGHKLLIIRLGFYKKLPQFDVILKHSFLYFMEQLDLDYENGNLDGICFVLDCQDISIRDADLDMLQFLVKRIMVGYCGLIKNFVVFELPFLLSYLVKIVEGWLPTYTDKNGNQQKLFAICTKKNIDEFIDADQRPKWMNGTAESSELSVPNNALPLIEFAKMLDVKESNITKIDQHVQNLIKEMTKKQ